MSKLKKALTKAKQERNGGEVASLGNALQKIRRQRPVEEPQITSIARPVRRKPKCRQEVNVEYRVTRVRPVDPEVLRKNKLFTLFKDNKITDHFDLIKAKVLKKLDKVDGNCLIVTSSNPGEGKTFTSINLGISIAREHNRTALVVDCDLRNPWRKHYDFASDFFGLPVEAGLVHYLEKKVPVEEIFINPGIAKLTIIPAGKVAPNSAELLGSPRMEFLMEELKSRYGNERIIILDCPAVLACADPLVLSQFADGILFVVESERTAQEELKKAMGLFTEEGKIIGAILNKTRTDEDRLPD